MALMKGHIFLRIVKEGICSDYLESSIAAIKYSQKEKVLFDQHLGTLFPFYNTSKMTLEWHPLRQIFTALAYRAKNGKEKCMDMLSDKQFYAFGSMINTMIHKKMGY